jgi:hypothetical protein
MHSKARGIENYNILKEIRKSQTMLQKNRFTIQIVCLAIKAQN